jgi:hypothetical protein
MEDRGVLKCPANSRQASTVDIAGFSSPNTAITACAARRISNSVTTFVRGAIGVTKSLLAKSLPVLQSYFVSLEFSQAQCIHEWSCPHLSAMHKFIWVYQLAGGAAPNLRAFCFPFLLCSSRIHCRWREIVGSIYTIVGTGEGQTTGANNLAFPPHV